jgi:L-threonylcarbamoyladenylate synthase
MSEHDDGPEILNAGDEAPSRALRKRVTRLLAGGALVALPTETVYGIAARADDEAALAALIEAKGRPADLALTWHVARREAIEAFAPLQAPARRLAQRYWPGPLTLVLSGVPEGLERVAREGWTGVRLPAHRLTCGILAGTDFPVVISSANRHGGDPATTAEEVARLFGREISLLLDGGPCRLGESSGVLQMGPGRFELLREGLLPLSDLQATAGLRLAFACTGNTCRSPMAELLGRDLIGARLGLAPGQRGGKEIARFGFEVRSLGVFAGSGSPASLHAVEVMRERGLDLGSHRSRPADPDELAEIDQVLCMTRSHLDSLRHLLPRPVGKRVQLLDPRGRDIPDPIGGSRQDYRNCAERILEAIDLHASDWV